MVLQTSFRRQNTRYSHSRALIQRVYRTTLHLVGIRTISVRLEVLAKRRLNSHIHRNNANNLGSHQAAAAPKISFCSQAEELLTSHIAARTSFLSRSANASLYVWNV
jgi:hypothetical protein